MSESEFQKHENEWLALRKLKDGEIIQMMESGVSGYRKHLATREWDRRAYARDRKLDRWLAIIAICLSASAFAVSLLAFLKH